MDVQSIPGTPAAVKVFGEVDLSNVGRMIEALDVAVSQSPTGVLVDLCDVTYIDSAGIQAVISAYQRLRTQDGVLALCLSNPDVQAIFRLIHPELLPGFVVTNDLDAARQALAVNDRPAGQ